jgi:hypothetical protein
MKKILIQKHIFYLWIITSLIIENYFENLYK